MSNIVTKQTNVDSCHIAERFSDKHMILALSTKVGSFEFVFSPEKWERLGETAGWFDVHVTNGAQPSAKETSK